MRSRISDDRRTSENWNTEGVHGPFEVVDPNAFRWSDTHWKGIRIEDLILDELHVGTFTPAGTFKGLKEKLPALKQIPDPQDPATFAASRLRWPEREEAPHAAALSTLGVLGSALRPASAHARSFRRNRRRAGGQDAAARLHPAHRLRLFGRRV